MAIVGCNPLGPCHPDEAPHAIVRCSVHLGPVNGCRFYWTPPIPQKVPTRIRYSMLLRTVQSGKRAIEAWPDCLQMSPVIRSDNNPKSDPGLFDSGSCHSCWLPVSWRFFNSGRT